MAAAENNVLLCVGWLTVLGRHCADAMLTKWFSSTRTMKVSFYCRTQRVNDVCMYVCMWSLFQSADVSVLTQLEIYADTVD